MGVMCCGGGCNERRGDGERVEASSGNEGWGAWCVTLLALLMFLYVQRVCRMSEKPY